ncbi:ATP-dependent RNA helicase p62-like [Tropilaelaps mercedesae]|uniref:ATP-dependent RNA helicase p62-like n=1 Tax=Tropilaelaps mercedesae TaxID=418985 RepID=A0A1V9X939_9ACAR|nr:ATP-dependent RNA helicase p62-like [Tropilaelaps mercedesae]
MNAKNLMFHVRALILRPTLSPCLHRGIVNRPYRNKSSVTYYDRRYNARNDDPKTEDYEIDEENLKKLERFAREREVIKNVYKESIVTSSRTDAEIKQFYKMHSITIEGLVPKPVLSIDELEVLPDLVKKEFQDRRIVTPTPIQSMCWPLAMSGADMIGIAQTGSGKTLGYLLPTALHIQAQPKSELKGPTSLVLAPTRELVQQISKVATEWLTFHLGIRNIGVYGGSDRGFQIRNLNKGSELCIATPGRLIDLLNTRMTSLANSSMLILDEADRMLDMGFEPQIRDIIEQMRDDRQTLMFSATWPQDVRQLASDFMDRQAVRINIGKWNISTHFIVPLT